MVLRIFLSIILFFQASKSFGFEELQLGLVKVRQAFLWKVKNQNLSVINLSFEEINDTKSWPEGKELEIATWLLGKVESQVIYGEKVEIIEVSGAWAKVRVKDHWTKKFPRGYEGWVELEHIQKVDKFESYQVEVVVKEKSATLYSGHLLLPLMTVSFDTRLKLLRNAKNHYEIELVDGSTGYIKKSESILSSEIKYSPESLIEKAKMFIGLNYIWAGASDQGFDCSGFTFRLFHFFGKLIPRDSIDQSSFGKYYYSKKNLKVGDLMFFTKNKKVSHVSIYIGDNQMIHSPKTGETIKIDKINHRSYTSNYWGFRRY
jgi:hypothetical protein